MLLQMAEFFPFYGWIFFIYSSADGHLGCFYVLVIVINAATNMGMQVSLRDSDFIFFVLNHLKRGRKGIWQTTASFDDKTLNKLGMKGTYHNIMKS